MKTVKELNITVLCWKVTTICVRAGLRLAPISYTNCLRPQTTHIRFSANSTPDNTTIHKVLQLYTYQIIIFDCRINFKFHTQTIINMYFRFILIFHGFGWEISCRKDLKFVTKNIFYNISKNSTLRKSKTRNSKLHDKEAQFHLSL